MRISKKKLLNMVNENLDEMAMDFDDENRPHPDIQRDLKKGDTPFKHVPLPKTGDEPDHNFQELLASERYRQVIQNLIRYTGFNRPLRSLTDMTPLLGMMMTAHQNIVNIENQHREELEDLAIRVVVDAFNIPEGTVEFDAKIVGMGEIPTDDFNKNDEQEENVEGEEELLAAVENIDLESAKRRFINSVIQGASKKGHYMYHMVANELEQITGDPNLINQYGILMSINDVTYWQVGNDMMKQAQNMVGGKENVERPEEEGGTTKIIARGVNFPILVHELIKGVMEVVGISGSPSDEQQNSEVIEREDTLQKEMWDLRLGPVIWDRLHSFFPDEALIDNKELQLYIIQAIFKLPPNKFFTFFKHVLENSPEGKTMMKSIIDGINKMLNDEDYTEEVVELKTIIDKSVDEMTNDELNQYIDQMMNKKKP